MSSVNAFLMEAYPRSHSTSTETQLEAVLARKAPNIPLPVDWSRHVKTGSVHAIALAQIALTAARARASKKRGIVARLRAKLEERDRKISLLRKISTSPQESLKAQCVM